MLYALFHNENLVGLFDSIENVKVLIKGLDNLNFAESKNFYLKEFHNNSLLFSRKISFNKKNNKKDSKKQIIIKDNIKDEKFIEQNKIKAELERKIFLLSEQKDKIKQKKTEYDTNLKLYELFSNKIKENVNFQIPKLFIDKYNLFKKLDDENRLELKNFYNEYKPQILDNSYMGMFMQNEEL